mgnify:CR=1 FL=1
MRATVEQQGSTGLDSDSSQGHLLIAAPTPLEWRDGERREVALVIEGERLAVHHARCMTDSFPKLSLVSG